MSEVLIESRGAALPGDLVLPDAAHGLVLFAHGSGSSRFSVRNRFVAEQLNGRGLATLLFDLLTPQEQVADMATAVLRFDIALLTERLAGAADWVHAQPATAALPLGLFGASTGAAATLNVAATKPALIGAVVSRGGRPDLADALPLVKAPTLLIVGGLDDVVLELNRTAAAALGGPHETAVVPGATHLFEEPGTLEQVARLAGEWFVRHLKA